MNTLSTTVVVSGHCVHCSYGERYVVHATPWCPIFPALAHVDTNGPWRGGLLATLMAFVSRPVAPGDLVFMFDAGDGNDVPFGKWGHVVETTERGSVLIRPCEGAWCRSINPPDHHLMEGHR